MSERGAKQNNSGPIQPNRTTTPSNLHLSIWRSLLKEEDVQPGALGLLILYTLTQQLYV
jgi:hypothetical protein